MEVKTAVEKIFVLW